MRQIMFVTIMTAILSPLAMFQDDDPFRNLGRMPATLERVEAVQIITTQARKIYGRVENLVSQHLEQLADSFIGD